MSDLEADDSPLTSPACSEGSHPMSSPVVSPATSPMSSVASPLSSAATSVENSSAEKSPAENSPAENSPANSSEGSIPIKRKKRVAGTESRTTMKRKLKCLQPQCDSDDEFVSENLVYHTTAASGSSTLPGAVRTTCGSPNERPENLTQFNSDSESSVENSGLSDYSSNEAADEVSDPLPNEQEAKDTGDDSDYDENTKSVENLFEGASVSSQEALLEVLKIYVEERWTKTSLDKNIKLIKKMLPQPNDMPSSSKSALRRLKLLTSSLEEKEYNYCKQCLQLWENSESECEYCQCKESSKFYIFSIEDQIRHMFEHRDLASILDRYRNHHDRKAGYICDVVDGLEYQNVRRVLVNKYDLVFLWNTDGVALSSSSKQELWPILCTICEVPPKLRYSFVIVGGVYVGEKKPDMNVFLKPFCESMQKYFATGVSWIHPKTKISNNSKVVAPALCADAPARALVIQCKNYNSKFGCNTCEQKSRKIPVNNENIVNPRTGKNRIRQRRFLFEEDVDPGLLRSGVHMDAQGERAEISGKCYKGVIGRAVVSQIPLLDRGLCICAEYLHLVALGVVKYLLLKIFLKRGPWYIGHKENDINQFISDIKVPDYIKRLPRGINEFKFWKASELRSFLLFYSVPIFKKFLPDKYFQHWILLVGAIHSLLQEAISDHDLKSAEILIRLFLRDIGQLYGEECYTYNMHTLSHVPLLVKRWGPLWATSAFPFESFNGFIAAHLHGTKHLGKELMNNIKISQRVAVLNNIVSSSVSCGPGFRIFDSDELLGKPINVHNFLSCEERAALAPVGNNVFAYNRAKVRSTIYTTALYDRDKKRADSYVQFKLENDDIVQYGQIVTFIQSDEADLLLCLVKLFPVAHVNLFHHESGFILNHLVPIAENTEKLIVISVHCIISKMLKVGMHLATWPNTIEVNL